MKDLKAPLLRHAQREEIKNNIAEAEAGLQFAKQEEKGNIRSNIVRSKRQLEEGSPEPLTGKEKDTLFALEKKLLNRITTNMPTAEVMRKNNAGAVDWHTKWEKHNKPLIRMWKNIKIQLNPDNADRDLTNLERYRPAGQMDRLRTDAQIPGVISFGNVPDENWPFDAPQNTALAQAQKVFDEKSAEDEVNSALESFDESDIAAPIEEGEKVPLSPEHHAELVQRLSKAREVLKQKREAERKLDETLQAAPVQED